jgi:hypothetical protein
MIVGFELNGECAHTAAPGILEARFSAIIFRMIRLGWSFMCLAHEQRGLITHTAAELGRPQPRRRGGAKITVQSWASASQNCEVMMMRVLGKKEICI